MCGWQGLRSRQEGAEGVLAQKRPRGKCPWGVEAVGWVVASCPHPLWGVTCTPLPPGTTERLKYEVGDRPGARLRAAGLGQGFSGVHGWGDSRWRWTEVSILFLKED